jgi:disulfide bond formation protein DsbB
MIKKLWNSPSFLVSFTLAQAVIAMLGSLYFSDVELYSPCALCWYQRIAVYPQAFLMAVALWRKDSKVYYYSLPLLVTGAIISLYHNWLYYSANFFNKSTEIIPCSVNGGPSCAEQYVEYFGFVSIPLLALVSMVVMIVCMLRLRAISKESGK